MNRKTQKSARLVNKDLTKRNNRERVEFAPVSEIPRKGREVRVSLTGAKRITYF